MAFMHYRSSLTRADVFLNPGTNSHVLQLDIKNRFIRFSTSHRRPWDAFPPSATTSFLFPVPQQCLINPAEAFSHVATLLLSLGIILNVSEVDIIASCLLRGGLERGQDSIVVLASVTNWKTDDVTAIRDDAIRSMLSSDALVSVEETLILDAVSSEETLIFDDVTSGPSGNSKRVELEKTTVEGGTCAICLDEFEEGSSVSRTLCAHIFHDECIEKWMRKKKTKADCPLCRSQLAA